MPVGARQAYSYPAEHARVRHQLNEAKKARVFFKTDGSSSGGRGKGKGSGNGQMKGMQMGKGKGNKCPSAS